MLGYDRSRRRSSQDEEIGADSQLGLQFAPNSLLGADAVCSLRVRGTGSWRRSEGSRCDRDRY